MKKTAFAYATLMALTLSACSGDNNVKEKLGLQQTPPEEFSVVTRAPLSVPPDYTLRPPRPGADRPMELSVREQTRQTVFGTADVRREAAQPAATTSSGFMNRLGAGADNASVRATIDAEIREMDKAEQPAAEKLLFWKEKEPRGKTIDPVEEQKRLESQIEKRNEDVLEQQ